VTPKKDHRQRGAAVDIDRSYTVNEFCAAERICRTALYKAWREGTGPRFYLNGQHKRITHQARLDWQQARERAASSAE
jgi:hypothetical protein